MKWIFSLALASMLGAGALAQSAPADAGRLQRELDATRNELSTSEKKLEQLQQTVEELRKQMIAMSGAAVQESNATPASLAGGPADPAFGASLPAVASAAVEPTGAPPADPTAAAADQDPQFLASKVNELHQVKVESGSRYPIRISGLVLFNTYLNHGAFDISDLPSLAQPETPGAKGDLGATLRQTMFAVEANGPNLMGAQSSADAAIDFFGGSPPQEYGITNGFLRLRTANARLNWDDTSLSIGQDAPFISPLSPTSYATLALPAFSWAGNLWVWTPEVVLEHRLAVTPDSKLILQSGFLDPLTEEWAVAQGRNPTSGEAARTPAEGARIAWDRLKSDLVPFQLGLAIYHARQTYGLNPTIQSWTVNSDLRLPLGKYMELSSELYHGEAAGGLGGGIWQSVVSGNAQDPYAEIHDLHSSGGWAQLKIMPVNRWEINAAMGKDQNYGRDLRFYSVPYSINGEGSLQQNTNQFINVIYKPNSVLVLALEYRRIITAPAVGPPSAGDHINMAVGVRF